MKAAVVIAILCGATAVAGAPYQAQYHAATDPCQGFQKKACQEEDACVYQMGERKYLRSRKESPTHHHEEAGKQSCQMKHMKDRVGEGKMMEKFGFGGEWDDMKCAEAFYMKDCKDLNQHVLATADVPQCAWNHKTGCNAYDGETRVYDLGPKPAIEPYTGPFCTDYFNDVAICARAAGLLATGDPSTEGYEAKPDAAEIEWITDISSPEIDFGLCCKLKTCDKVAVLNIGTNVAAPGNCEDGSNGKVLIDDASTTDCAPTGCGDGEGPCCKNGFR